MLLAQLALDSDITDIAPYVTNDDWVFEQKLDGHRVLLVSPEADLPPTALTRNGTPYTRRLPKALQDFRFPEGRWVLDGELMGDGTYWVFDLPVTPFGGELELKARRAMLETLLGNLPGHPFQLVPQARTVDDKVHLARTAIERCLEGLVLKRADSLYRQGARNRDWLKLKFVKTADVIVLDVRDDGKESARLGIMRDGKVIDVGRASLIGKEKRGAISSGDVVEVRFLYCNNPAAPRLYQPTIMRRREDKAAHECTDDQLQYTSKEVLQGF